MLLGVMSCAPAFANEDFGARGIIVEELRNERAPFMVRVDVDHSNRIYQLGDMMRVTVTSEKPGYLYLFYFMADGKVSCLFPNKYQTENFIPPNRKVVVPALSDTFRIRIGPPFGWEVLKAVVSPERLKSLDVEELTKGHMMQVETRGVRGAYVEQLKPDPAAWAEHDVWIHTVERQEGDAKPSGTARRTSNDHDGKLRVGVFIGIAEFQDKRIRPLQAPGEDARQLERLMCETGKLDKSFVLIDGEATLQKIRQTICGDVARMTGPGDTVIIYASTHGARCSDKEGDEDDGFDEFLAVHDTNIDTTGTVRTTALMDDAFGRWLQLLDGREVIVLLDTCHSGGQAGKASDPSEKGLRSWDHCAKGFCLPGTLSMPDQNVFDFLDGEMIRAKDIGQRDAVLLAAADASQKAFERRSGDLSVMTYYLLELLKSQGQVTLQDAYEYVADKVPAYVEATFPGTTQTPVLVPEEDSKVGLFLRP
jgi:hypothetical protein